MPNVRIGLPAALIGSAALILSPPAEAACNATVNGLPMPPQMCALTAQLYGAMQSGDYWMDEHGNWGFAGDPRVHGNIRFDSQRPRQGGTPWTYLGANGNQDRSGPCVYASGSAPGTSVLTGHC